MTEMVAAGSRIVDIASWGWFALSAVSVAYIAYDVVTSRPKLKVMRWNLALVTLYTGPVGLIVYWLSCSESMSRTDEKSGVPLWKQSLEATFHCLAGCGIGVIVAVVITSLLKLPMGVERILEYAASFVLGLFLFQALLIKQIIGCNYGQAVKVSCFAQWISVNAVMAGMIPVMVVLMSRYMHAVEPAWLRFWGILSLSSLAGAALAYPVNYWMVKNGLQPGMGDMKRGDHSHSTFAASKLAATLVTVLMLAGGITLAALYGGPG